MVVMKRETQNFLVPLYPPGWVDGMGGWDGMGMEGGLSPNPRFSAGSFCPVPVPPQQAGTRTGPSATSRLRCASLAAADFDVDRRPGCLCTAQYIM
jgi:hypothetical protein